MSSHVKKATNYQKRTEIVIDEEVVLIKLSIALQTNMFNIKEDFCLDKMASYIGISPAQLETIASNNRVFEGLIQEDSTQQ